MQPMTLVYVIAGLIFAGVAVLVVAAIVDSRAAKLRERVERLQAPAIMAGSPLAQELQRSVFERVIHLEGDLSQEERDRLMDIAERCPVSRTLSAGSTVTSRLADDPPPGEGAG